MRKRNGVIAGIVLAVVGIAGLLIATRSGASGDAPGAAAPRAGEAPPAGSPLPPAGAVATAPGLPPVDSRFPPAVDRPPPLSPDEMQGHTGEVTAYPGAYLDGYPTPVDKSPTDNPGADADQESNEEPRDEGAAEATVVEVPTTVDPKALASLYERLGITEIRRVGPYSRILLPDGVDAARVEREMAQLASPR